MKTHRTDVYKFYTIKSHSLCTVVVQNCDSDRQVQQVWMEHPRRLTIQMGTIGYGEFDDFLLLRREV